MKPSESIFKIAKGLAMEYVKRIHPYEINDVWDTLTELEITTNPNDWLPLATIKYLDESSDTGVSTTKSEPTEDIT